MDTRVVRLRTAAFALRTQLAAVAQQAHAAAHAEAAHPHTQEATEEEAQLLGGQQEMTGEKVQLHTEAARLDAKAEAIEAYRAARTSQWGCELPESLLGEVFSHLGWRCGAVRLVCAGWSGAHDKLLPRLQFRIPRALVVESLPEHVAESMLRGMAQVTEVQITYTGPSMGGIPSTSSIMLTQDDKSLVAWNLPQLLSLPALTSLTLDIPDKLTVVAARALGSLTMLTSLELHRGDMESLNEWDNNDEQSDLVRDEYVEEHREAKLAEGWDNDGYWDATTMATSTKRFHISFTRCSFQSVFLRSMSSTETSCAASLRVRYGRRR